MSATLQTNVPRCCSSRSIANSFCSPLGRWSNAFKNSTTLESRCTIITPGREQLQLIEALTSNATKQGPTTARAKVVTSDPGQPLLAKPDSAKSWVLDPTFSDEFNTSAIDRKKWITDMQPWGERAWSPDNLFQKDGSIFIRARYEPHTHKGTQYFYKLAILQSRQKSTYGFFEARIKGCSRFPGLCPAFWLYSNGKDLNPKYPNVTYSEIDIVEMLQGLYEPELKTKTGPNHVDCNLHCRILKDGKEIWQRPNSLPEVCKHYWEAPWDPRDDYHVYACENTPQKITWYIDGKKVAEADNLYWHLPMSVTLTMELRPPFIDWAGVDGRVPVADAATAEGFPTEMAVDYVRCWTRQN